MTTERPSNESGEADLSSASRPSIVRRLLSRFHPRRFPATVRWLTQLFGQHWRLRHRHGLTVAVDIDPLYQPLTGVGWYLRMLLCELADRDDVELRLYGPALQGVSEAGPHPSMPLPEGKALALVSHRLRDDLLLSAHLQNRLLRLLQPLFIWWHRNQVVFAPNFIVPRRLRWCRGELVVTVHDLAMRTVPETLADETKALLDANLEQALDRAAHLLTPSETVRHEIIDQGLFPEDRVHAVLHGPGHLEMKRSIQSAVPSQDLHDEDSPAPVTPRPFVLHVGTIEPRKNLALLLDVWEQAQEHEPGFPLLMWCGRVGWKSEELMQRAQRGIDAGWLAHHGYVDDEQLATLYRSALCVAVPSRYEGFGLPLVEAMSAETAVVCSDIDVFREVAGGAALLVSLGDPEAWQVAIRRVRDDSELRQQLVRKGRERVDQLDWRRSAEATLEVLRSAAGRATGGPERAEGTQTARVSPR